jgi:hypothetical protein
VAFSELWAVEMIVAAFAGGALGASIGALPSFTLAGGVVVVGELYALVGRTTGMDLPVDLTGDVAFGVVLGPHVAFGGGAAALAYAVKRGYVDADFEYHDAKLVTRGLGNRIDVLTVGGIFGVVGYWIATLSGTLGIPTDPVALGVVLSALLHRLAFGYSLVGAPLGRLLDMTPFERDARRDASPVAATDGGDGTGDTIPDGGVEQTRVRLLVEPWLPYMYKWHEVLFIGAVMGVLGGYIAYLTGSAFLAFGISVVALVYVNADVADIPVTHHMTLPASTAVIAYAGAGAAPTPAELVAVISLPEALVLGGAFGLLGAFFGELLQRVLYAHAETHLDPPAASIVATSLLVGVLALVGVLPGSAWVPLPL